MWDSFLCVMMCVYIYLLGIASKKMCRQLSLNPILSHFIALSRLEIHAYRF